MGWQIRQSRNEQAIHIYSEVMQSIHDNANSLLENPDLAELIVRAEAGDADFTAAERLRINVYMSGRFDPGEIMISALKGGLGTEESATRARFYLTGLALSPARRKWYRKRAHTFSPTFQNYMQDILKNYPDDDQD